MGNDSRYIRKPDLARDFGVCERTIDNWERREGFPSPDRVPVSGRPIGYLRKEVEKWRLKCRAKGNAQSRRAQPDERPEE